MEAARLRLRLVFDDRGMLTKSQKLEGLKHSWILLKPHFLTVSDVVSYVFHRFDLSNACPNGIVLSMDGFVLPGFESTAILKDGDLISVKKREPGLRDLPKAIERAKTLIEDAIVDKQPLPSGTELLANEQYDKEIRGYESETDVHEDDAHKTILPVENACMGDVPTKKRKASNKNENSKVKRQRRETPEAVQKKHVHCEPTKTDQEKRKLKNGSKHDSPGDPKVTVNCAKNLEPTSNSNECMKPEASREGAIAASDAPDGAKKVNRNTMRKRLQRERRKKHRAEDKTSKQCEKQLPVKNLNANSRSKKDVSTNIIQQHQADEDSGAEGDLVPVMIRPGHIRFTPSGKVNDVRHIQEANVWSGPSTQKSVVETHRSNKSGWDVHSTTKSFWKGHSSEKNSSSIQRNQVAKGTCQWNGITNKRKGQKWGTGKQPTSWNESRSYNAHSSGTWATRKQAPRHVVMDFDKLVPLIDLPKAGDIVAYRLLELSSSWCPKLSSFRIGKISWFESKSNRIMLIPDPEYPLKLEKKKDDHDDDNSGLPPESSLYNEDGSLEIDFSSLVDVRIVNRGDLTQSVGTATPTANCDPAPPGTTKRINETQDGSKSVLSDVGNGDLCTPTPVNGKKDVWEAISEALSAKKAQLSQEDSWNKKKVSPSTRSWSQRTLRGRALGPPMAMLRAPNGT